jgi:hypothetical protein
MPKFIIEREMPGVGQAPASALQGAAQTSCSVLREMGPEIQWVESYVTGNKIYCVYLAPNEEMIREHAQRGGFPGDGVGRSFKACEGRQRGDDRGKLLHQLPVCFGLLRISATYMPSGVRMF